MWNLRNWYRGSYLQGEYRDADAESRQVDMRRGKEVGWDKLGDWDFCTYTATCKMARSCCRAQGAKVCAL